MPQTGRTSRDAALVELQRLHTAILASRARRGAGPENGPPRSASSAEALAAQALTRRLQADDAPSTLAEVPDQPRSRRLWWLAVAAAVIGAGAWAATTLSQRPEVVTEAAPPRSGAPAGSATAASGSAPATASSGAAAVAPAAAPARPVQLTLATIRPVWLRVTVDGTRALQGEIAAGETLSFGADRVVIVRSGDAGGVRATLNGTDRGALGLRGWPLTVSITPEGIQPLTATRPER